MYLRLAVQCQVLQHFCPLAGGLICISGVKERWDGDPEYHQRMRSVIAELEVANKLKMLEDSIVNEYYFYQHWNPGVFLLMQKIQS